MLLWSSLFLLAASQCEIPCGKTSDKGGCAKQRCKKIGTNNVKICAKFGGSEGLTDLSCSLDECKNHCANTANVGTGPCKYYAFDPANKDCYVFESCILEESTDYDSYALVSEAVDMSLCADVYDPKKDDTPVLAVPKSVYQFGDSDWEKKVCRKGSCAWGAIATELMLEGCRECDLVFFPTGGIRPDNVPPEKRGSDNVLRVWHMHYVNKYGNAFSRATYPGTVVKAALLRKVLGHDPEDPELPYFSSNVRVAFDPAAPAGARLWFRERDAGCESWVEFDTARTYTVGTDSYTIAKEDNFAAAAAEVTEVSPNLADIVNKFLPTGNVRWQSLGSCGVDVPTNAAFDKYCHISARNDAGAGVPSTTCKEVHVVISQHTRGALLPQNKYSSDCDPSYVEEKPYKCNGGIARRATVIKNIRDRFPGKTMVLDGGNHYFGGTFFYFFQGLLSQQLINALQYDAVAANYKDYFSDNAHTYYAGLNMPIVCSNCDGNTALASVPWFVMNLDGVKVGLLVQWRDEALELVKNVKDITVNTFNPTVGGQKERSESNSLLTKLQPTRTLVNMLRAKNNLLQSHPDCKTIVVVSCDYTENSELVMEAMEEVAFMATKDEVGLSFQMRHYEMLGSNRIAGTGHTQNKGASLQHVTMDLENNGKVRFVSSHDVPLDHTVAQERAVWSVIKEKFEEMSIKLGIEVGIIPKTIEYDSKNTCRSQDCPAARVTAEAARHAFGTAENVITMLNVGGVRASLLAGPVTQADLLKVIPFQNMLQVKTLTGTQLIEVLRRSVKQFGDGGFLQSAGLRYAIQTEANSASGKNELANVQYKNKAGEWINVVPGDKTYPVAFPEFITGGGDGYDMLPALPTDPSFPVVRDSACLADYIPVVASLSADDIDTFADLTAKCTNNVQTEGYGQGCRVILTSMNPDPLLEGKCPPGSILVRGIICEACPAGTFKIGEFGTECTQCSPGNFQEKSGQSECSKCTSGSWRDDSDDATNCIPCKKGFIRKEGDRGCSKCPLGLYVDVPGMNECYQCPPGTYADTSDGSECTTCPKSFTTEWTGTTEGNKCICAAGQFWNRRDDRCDGCQLQGVCDEVGLGAPTVWKGHYGVYDGTVDSQQIDKKLAGGYVGDTNAFYKLSIYACRSGQCDPQKGKPDGCFFNREAIACAICPEGKFGFECGGCKEGGAIYVLIVFIVLCPFATWGGCVVTSKPYAAKATAAFQMASTFGIMAIFVQMLGMMGGFNIDWGWFRSFFGFAELFLLDLEVLGLGCVVGNSFTAQFYSSFLLPVLVGLALLLDLPISRVVPSIAGKEVRLTVNGCLNFMGMVYSALYISLVKLVVAFFECVPNPAADDTLAKYKQVVCQSQEHKTGTAAVVIGMIVYVVGFFVLCLYLNVIAPASFQNPVFRARCKFLVNRWRVDTWYWGSVAMARNLLLAFIAVISSTAVDQFIMMGIILMIFLASGFAYMPWKDPRLAHFDNAVCMCVFFAISCGIGFMHLNFQKKSYDRDTSETALKAVKEIDSRIYVFRMLLMATLAVVFLLFASLVVYCIRAMKYMAKLNAQEDARNELLAGRFNELFDLDGNDVKPHFLRYITTGTHYDVMNIKVFLDNMESRLRISGGPDSSGGSASTSASRSTRLRLSVDGSGAPDSSKKKRDDVFAADV